MTAVEAKELAEQLSKLSAFEIGLVLLETDHKAWKRGYFDAEKTYKEVLGSQNDKVSTQKEL